MYCCALCGSLLFKRKIFCNSCIEYPSHFKKRKTKNFEHFYFYEWNAFSKALIVNIKQGRHQKTLKELAPFFQYQIKKIPLASKEILVAPNSKQTKYQKNHSYQIALAMGFKAAKDCLIKRGEQKSQDQWERQKISIESKGDINNARKIIVIDDMVTTGSTMDAIYKLLKPQKMLVISLVYVSKKE